MSEEQQYNVLIEETLADLDRSAPGSPPVIIAFCGIPGSGKTTLGRRLAEDLRMHYIRQDDIRFKAYKHGFKDIVAHRVSVPIFKRIVNEYENKSILLDASIDRTWLKFLDTCRALEMKPLIIRIIVDYDEAAARLRKRGDPDDLQLLKRLPELFEDFKKCQEQFQTDLTVSYPYEYGDVLATVKEKIRKMNLN